jgi:hypothetical protein
MVPCRVNSLHGEWSVAEEGAIDALRSLAASKATANVDVKWPSILRLVHFLHP